MITNQTFHFIDSEGIINSYFKLDSLYCYDCYFKVRSIHYGLNVVFYFKFLFKDCFIWLNLVHILTCVEMVQDKVSLLTAADYI